GGPAGRGGRGGGGGRDARGVFPPAGRGGGGRGEAGGGRGKTPPTSHRVYPGGAARAARPTHGGKPRGSSKDPSPPTPLPAGERRERKRRVGREDSPHPTRTARPTTNTSPAPAVRRAGRTLAGPPRR